MGVCPRDLFRATHPIKHIPGKMSRTRTYKEPCLLSKIQHPYFKSKHLQRSSNIDTIPYIASSVRKMKWTSTPGALIAQDGSDLKRGRKQELGRMCSNWGHLTLPWERQMLPPLWNTVWQFLPRFKCLLTQRHSPLSLLTK